VEATSTDDSDNTDTDTYTDEFAINFYSSITVNTATHTWNVLAGQSNITISEGSISITVTTNANYNIRAKGSGNLANGTNTIALSNVLMHLDTLASSISLTTNYQDIPGLTNQARGVDQSKTFVLWLSVPAGTQNGLYTYTLYVAVAEYS